MAKYFSSPASMLKQTKLRSDPNDALALYVYIAWKKRFRINKGTLFHAANWSKCYRAAECSGIIQTKRKPLKEKESLVLFQQKERHGRWGACKQDMKRAQPVGTGGAAAAAHLGSLRRRKEAASPSARLGANAIQICDVLKIPVTFGGCSFSCLTSTYAKWFEGAQKCFASQSSVWQ